MYNPFVLLTTPLLDALLHQPMYFVRQSFPRGGHALEKPGTVCLLITHYAHHEINNERAKRHLGLLKNDPYRFLYDSTNPAHLAKLKKAAQQPEGYKIYTNILLKKWQAPPLLRNKVYAYLRHKFSPENFGRNAKLNIRLQDLFGELYLVLSWKSTKVEVHLDEIENFNSYVL